MRDQAGLQTQHGHHPGRGDQHPGVLPDQDQRGRHGQPGHCPQQQRGGAGREGDAVCVQAAAGQAQVIILPELSRKVGELPEEVETDDAEEGVEGRHRGREGGRGHGHQAASDGDGASLVAASQH